MTNKENVLAKAIHNLFQNDPSVYGIAKGKPSIDDGSNCMPHQYEWINDLYKLKLVEDLGDSRFFESISSAFADIHSYRFINDHKFSESLITRLKAIGIPLNEIKIAIEAIKKVMVEIKKEYKMKADDEFDEKSAGWHHDLEGIKKVSQQFNRKPERVEANSGGGPWPKEKEFSNITENLTKTPDNTLNVDIGHSNSVERILKDLKNKEDLFNHRGDTVSAHKYGSTYNKVKSIFEKTNNPAEALRAYEELLRKDEK